MTQRGEEVVVGLDDQICSLGTSRSTEKPPAPITPVLLEGSRRAPSGPGCSSLA